MQLNNPPVLTHFLLEQPLPAIVLLFAATVVILLLAGRRGDRRLARFSLLPVLLAILIFFLAMMVTTGREQLLINAQALVSKTAPMDIDGLRTLFSETATLQGPDGEVWLNRAQILTELERIDQRHGIQSHAIRDLQAELRSVERGQLKSTRGLTLIDLRTALNTPLGSYKVDTLWLVTWKQDNDDAWRIVTIQWLQLQGQRPSFGSWR